jgi:hypothetical protein
MKKERFENIKLFGLALLTACGIVVGAFALSWHFMMPTDKERQARANWIKCFNWLDAAIHSPTLILAQERIKTGNHECQKIENTDVLVQNLEAIRNKQSFSEVKSDLKEQVEQSLPIFP